MVGKFASGGLSAACGVIALAGLAHAETARQAAAQAGHRKILDPISITATRNPIKSFEYPGMVSVIGREEIQTRQPSTPDDILKFVPNVEFTGGPRRTGEVPSIRGHVVAEGTPHHVLTEAMIRHAFELPVSVSRHPTRGCPHVIAI